MQKASSSPLPERSSHHYLEAGRDAAEWVANGEKVTAGKLLARLPKQAAGTMDITGAVITETIFAIPGIGRYYVTAVTGRDYSVVMGLTVLLALIVIVASFALHGGPATRALVAAGVIWLSVAFSAVLALGRAWQRERVAVTVVLSNHFVRYALVDAPPRGVSPMAGKGRQNFVLAEGRKIGVVELARARARRVGLETSNAARAPDRLSLRRPGVYPLVVEVRDTEDRTQGSFTTFVVAVSTDTNGLPVRLPDPLGAAWVWPLPAGASMVAFSLRCRWICRRHRRCVTSRPGSLCWPTTGTCA